MDLVAEWTQRCADFETDCHTFLSLHESSPSRIVRLDESYGALAKLNVAQDDLIRQALRCVEQELYRAAHVMAWAAFMDFFEEKLASDGLVRLRAVRPTWKLKDLVEMREYQAEHNIIEAAKEIGLCTKTEMKGLHGLLNKRNQCAHPSDFFPGLNEALGYLSELFHYFRAIGAKPGF